MLLGFLEGYDLLIVLAVVALLFGGSQLPKLARSLGSASHEFKKGVEEGHKDGATPAAGPEPKASLTSEVKHVASDVKEVVSRDINEAKERPSSQV